jgi:hypothetical protein
MDVFERGSVMTTETPNTVPSSDHVVDLLWKQYRTLAERTLNEASPTANEDSKRSAQGVMSLFVANCITRWVDRIEREPDAQRRRQLVDLLLGG